MIFVSVQGGGSDVVASLIDGKFESGILGG